MRVADDAERNETKRNWIRRGNSRLITGISDARQEACVGTCEDGRADRRDGLQKAYIQTNEKRSRQVAVPTGQAAGGVCVPRGVSRHAVRDFSGDCGDRMRLCWWCSALRCGPTRFGGEKVVRLQRPKLAATRSRSERGGQSTRRRGRLYEGEDAVVWECTVWVCSKLHAFNVAHDDGHLGSFCGLG